MRRQIGLGRTMQKTPNVTNDDILRIVERDFAAESLQAILDAISATDVREKQRVVAACLKNSNGDFVALLDLLRSAPGYWRDIISVAEYPLDNRKGTSMEKMSKEERQKVHDLDWQQYQDWFEKA